MEEFAARDDVYVITTDQCAFGLRARDSLGWALVKKPTKFITNSWYIAKNLNRRCRGGHRHSETVGQGERLMRVIERYPVALVNAVLRGLRQEAIASNMLSSLEAGFHVDEPDVWRVYPEYYNEIYDAISGQHLDPVLVSLGRKDEM